MSNVGIEGHGMMVCMCVTESLGEMSALSACHDAYHKSAIHPASSAVLVNSLPHVQQATKPPLLSSKRTCEYTCCSVLL